MGNDMGEVSVGYSLSRKYRNVIDDADDMTETGAYIINESFPQNMPEGSYKWGTMIVFSLEPYRAVQLYVPDAYSHLYIRTKYNGEWRAWHSLSMADV